MLNSGIKRLLSNGLNMAAIKNALIKRRSPLSNVDTHTKTVILLGIFSYCLINFVNLSTTFFYSKFFNVFFHKKRDFYSWGQRFYIYAQYSPTFIIHNSHSFSAISQISTSENAKCSHNSGKSKY